MENDFINFKNKENKDVNTLPLLHSPQSRTEPYIPVLSTKRNTIIHHLSSISSPKIMMPLNRQNEKLKDFLFNPDQQGKGRCHAIPDPATCHIPGVKDRRTSGVKVRFNDFINKRVGDRRTQVFFPHVSPNSEGKGESILKSLVNNNNNKRFSINQSRNSIKQFLGVLDAFAKQNKNKAVNANILF